MAIETKSTFTPEELRTKLEALLALVKDPQPGLSSWQETLQTRLGELKDLVFVDYEGLPESWRKLLKAGWQIWRTSCGCGGDWAWVKPRPSGAYEMHGCVCHQTPHE